MTDILRQWVSNDVGVQVQSLAEELSSGYKLGLILSKLNLQPDFEQFDASGTPDALINNFTRLQPTMKHLGIRFDAPRATALMREDKGAAAQMIYDIRAAVKEHSGTLKSSYAPPMGKSLGIKSELNRTLLEARHHRNKLQTFEFFQGEHFEDVLRKHAQNPKTLAMEMHTLPFANEGARQAALAEQAAEAAAAAAQAKRSAFRASQLNHDKAVRMKAADFDQHVSKVHLASQVRHAAMHSADVRVQQSLAQKAAARKQLAQAATALDVTRNIDEFEEKLARMAVRGPGTGATGRVGGSPTIKAGDVLPPVGKTPYEQVQRIRQFLPDQDLLKLEAQEYMQRMHDRRKVEMEGVKQREVRRRRLLMDVDAAVDADQTAGQLAAVVEGLQRESAEEARIAARLKQLAAEEDVLVSNRNQRMAQYTERRERDWAEAIAREVELSQALKAQVADEVERERREWRRAQARRREEKQAKHERMARAVVRDAVGLALMHAVHREQCGLDVPPKVAREWVAMFHAQDVRLRSADEQIDAEAAKIVDDTMDGATLHDYLHGDGEWSPTCLSALTEAPRPETATSRPGSGQPTSSEAQPEPAFAAIGFNKPLAAAVHAVRQCVQPPPQDAAPALDLPIRIAVVGGPFCGKTTLAQGLAEAHNAVILDAEVLVNNAVQAAGVYLDPEPQIVEEEVPCSANGEDPESGAPDAAAAIMAADSLLNPEQQSSADNGRGTPGKPAEQPTPATPHSTDEPRAGDASAGDSGTGEGDATGAVEAAAKVADVNLTRTKVVQREIPPPPPPQQVVIGRRAQDALLDGQQLSDSDTAALVADAIEKLQEGYTAWRAATDDSGAPAVDDNGKPTHPQGFILDGFPRTEQQAKELEKALTGLDVAAEEAYAAGASRVAPPGAAAFLSPSRPIKSCLDTVVVLELENSEVAVERAVGRRMDPETGKIYHMQLSPPPGDAPGLLERLIPVTSPSNDTEQLQKRLQVHVDTAPGLRTWLRRFDRLVWMVCADVPPEDLLAEVQTIAATAQEGKEAAAQSAAAALAAQAARATAEEAQARAAEAMHAASAAARELLLAKRAEVEAEALVRKPSTPDPKAGKGGKKDSGPPGEVDPEMKKAQDAAAALLAEQAGLRCAEHLKEAERASQEAQVRAEEAAAAATAAADACAQARRSAHDAAKSREAEERAAAAAEAAEAARAATAAAAQTAAASAASAAATVAAAQAQAAGPPEELPAPADLLAASGGAPVPGGSAEDSSATGVSGRLAAKEPEPVQPVHPLDADSAHFLHELWCKMEASYVRGGKLAFAGLRRLRASVLERLHAAQLQFAGHLQRPDQRQAELAAFQVQFNLVDLDLLRLPEVKAELALQVDELRDRLWKICDDKLANNTKLHSELTDPALEDSSKVALAAGYAALVQAEVDRFKATVAFARDHAARCANLPPLGIGFTHVDVLGGANTPTLAPFMPAAGTCEWTAVEGLDQVTSALRCACAVLAQDERDTIAAAVEAAATAARPASGKKGSKTAPPPAEPTPQTPAAAAAAAAAAARERVDAADATVKPLLERERAILTQRLQAIAARAGDAAAELHGVVSAVSERLARLMHDRFRAECASVASVTVAAAEAVRAGELLPHALTIADGEAVVDESTIIVPQPPRKAPAAPPLQPLAPGLLNGAQLSALVRAARNVTTSEFIMTRDCTDLLQALSAVRGDTPEAFPVEWQRATWKQMHDALAELDGHASGYVDWLEVAASLVLHACPQIVDAAPKAFAAAAAALSAADGDADGAVTQQEWEGCELWFEAQRRRPGCEEDLEAANALLGEPQEAPSHWQAGIKQLLWDMFWEEVLEPPLTAAPQSESSSGAASGLGAEALKADESDAAAATTDGAVPGAPLASTEEPTPAATPPTEAGAGTSTPHRKLNINRMLLYLCADKELPLAVRKAFAVLSRDASPRATLPASTVVTLLYPSGTAAGEHIFKVPYSEAEAVALLLEARPHAQEAQPEEGAEPEEVHVTADNLVYSVAGARLLAACGQRYRLRDVFLDCWRVMPAAE